MKKKLVISGYFLKIFFACRRHMNCMKPHRFWRVGPAMLCEHYHDRNSRPWHPSVLADWMTVRCFASEKLYRYCRIGVRIWRKTYESGVNKLMRQIFGRLRWQSRLTWQNQQKFWFNEVKITSSGSVAPDVAEPRRDKFKWRPIAKLVSMQQ